MGIQLEWDEKVPNMVIMRYQKPWTWDDFNAVTAQLEALSHQRTDSFYLAIDVREAGYPPKGAFNHFKRVTDMNMPQLAGVMFIAPQAISIFVNLMNNTLASIYGDNYKQPQFQFFKSLQDARWLVTGQTESSHGS